MATTIEECPACGSDTFAPMALAGGDAFVRLTTLREDQAKRGDIVVGGPQGFIARLLSCKECGFVGLFHAGDAPEGSGGASIHLGGGGSFTAR